MCGHGLIGLAETPQFMGEVSGDDVRIDILQNFTLAAVWGPVRVAFALASRCIFRAGGPAG